MGIALITLSVGIVVFWLAIGYPVAHRRLDREKDEL